MFGVTEQKVNARLDKLEENVDEVCRRLEFSERCLGIDISVEMEKNEGKVLNMSENLFPIYVQMYDQ